MLPETYLNPSRLRRSHQPVPVCTAVPTRACDLVKTLASFTILYVCPVILNVPKLISLLSSDLKQVLIPSVLPVFNSLNPQNFEALSPEA